MSLNISTEPRELTPAERFSVAAVGSMVVGGVLFLAMILYLFGWKALASTLLLMAGGEWLVRTARKNLLGQRKSDRVMMPALEASFTCHRFDADMGWSLKPDSVIENHFHIPRKRLSRAYVVTTDDLGRRISAGDACEDSSVISIYGDSFTFGWGLSDYETYPWLLQERFRGYRIYNYGVSGYSLYQMLKRMEQTVPTDRPRLVVLGFGDELETRSVNSYAYLKRLAEVGGAAPSCLSKKGRNGRRALHRYPVEAYKRLPGSDSSLLLKLCEVYLNRLRFLGRDGMKAQRLTTEHLLLGMHHLCQREGAEFYIACLSGAHRYAEFIDNAEFNWSPCPVHLDDCRADGTYIYRLYPFDGHPNAAAQRCYADAIERGIRAILETGRHRSVVAPLTDAAVADDAAAAIYPMY